MQLIYFLLRSSWHLVAIAIITGAISGACSARLIASINYAVSGNQVGGQDLVLNFVLLVMLAIVTGLISQIWLIRLSQKAVFDMQLHLSRQILSSSLRHLETLGAPKLLATLTDDVQAVSNSIFVIPFLCIDLALVVGCLIYLGWLSSYVFLFLIAFMTVAILSIQLLLGKAQSFLHSAREQQDKLFKHFRTIADGIKELKLHYQRQQAFLNEELAVAAFASRGFKVKSLSIFAFATNWGQVLFFTVVGLLMFLLPKLMEIQAVVLSGYILTITYIMMPLRSILDMLPSIGRAEVALRKIEALGLSLAQQSEELRDIKSLAMLSNCQKLELIDLKHTYWQEREETNFVLGPVNLTFKPGELTFIVGGNGSGKSTLVKLLTGLYSPEAGEICLDGQTIGESDRVWYRQHFSVVFSDFYLFDRFLGLDNTTVEEKAQDYLNQLHLAHKVQIKDDCLSTLALSQGQRKRLALLTAYLEDRPIYVFDEWASDQDPIFKELFYSQLLPELSHRGKIVIVISHDDRYFHLADRIIKLDYGQVEYDKLRDS